MVLESVHLVRLPQFRVGSRGHDLVGSLALVSALRRADVEGATYTQCVVELTFLNHGDD